MFSIPGIRPHSMSLPKCPLLLSVMNMDTLLWTVHTECHPQVHLHIIVDHNPSIDITAAQPHATVPQIGTKAADLDHDHTTKDTAAKVAINPSEHILGHTIETTGALRGVVHANSIHTCIHTTPAMTPHIEDPPLIEAHQPIHKIAVDHALGQPISQLRKPPIKIHLIPEDPTETHTIKGIKESP